jgi:hypothetical protein
MLMSKKEEQEEKQSDFSPKGAVLTIRDLAVVATELRECAPAIHAKVRRLEESQRVTQEILDLEFTI